MAVLIIQRMPPMFAAEQYDQVNERLGAEDEPPAGLIAHTLGTSGDGAAMADVWESVEAFETFRNERLNPTLEAVMGAEAFAQAPTPEREFYEVHDHFALGS